MIEIFDKENDGAVIKVIGVGGCGGNAVEHMMTKSVTGVEFICANTDMQALKKSHAKVVLQIGSDITKGLGAGAKPEIGREAALEDRDRIAEMIDGADMLFITAGMGGGTGTGAAPIIAEVAKEMGILTVAVVTKPFAFEGKRSGVAKEGLEELSKHVDSLIIIPNDKLMEVLGDDVTFLDAFKAANDVLHNAVSGPISGLAPAPRPLVMSIPICKLFLALLFLSACISVFAQMNSTPPTFFSIMCSTALPPQPPTPMTLMTASWLSLSIISNIVFLLVNATSA